MTQTLPPDAFPGGNAITRAGDADRFEDGQSAARSAADGLPCQNSNNSIGTEDATVDLWGPIPEDSYDPDRPGGRITSQGPSWRIVSPHHAKTAFALRHDIKCMIERHGIEQIGFLTLTFREHITDGREAQRRFNSLATNILRPRYSEYVTNLERQLSGRFHFHLCANVGSDIRTGLNFAAIENRDYKTANAALRKEWAFWLKTMPQYGFGRHELLPIKSTAECVAGYLGKYISKHVSCRQERDKGLRLVRYSLDARKASVRFSWNTVGMRKWRQGLAALAAFNGITDYGQLQQLWGPRWAYYRREQIMTFLDSPESLQDGAQRIASPPTPQYAYDVREGVYRPARPEGSKAVLSATLKARLLAEGIDPETCNGEKS